MNKPFLDCYSGQTIQELIALKDSHRIDSLVLAVEQALRNKPDAELSEPERVVLAVEAMEREVNNGGYQQFFGNPSREYAGFLVRALGLIRCPKVAAVSAEAIAVLDLPEPIEAESVKHVVTHLSAEKQMRLDECDSRYYASDENIGQCLFSFIEEHQREIQLPQEAGAEQSDMSSSNKRYELTGCVLGGLIGLAFWFWPLPVGWAVSLFDLQGNFADYMYLAAPVALLFPLIGAIIGRRMDK